VSKLTTQRQLHLDAYYSRSKVHSRDSHVILLTNHMSLFKNNNLSIWSALTI